MKDIFIKNKKVFFIILPLFFIIFFLYLAFFRLNVLVSLGIRAFTHATMKIEKVIIKEGSNFKEGRIEIINSQMFDKKELIADTPKIFIDYKNWKIERINIYNPKVVFVRDDSDINFVTVFTGKDDKPKKKNKNSGKSNKVKLSNPILKKINIYNADMEYNDISYTERITKNIKDVNGYINFEKGYKVDLKFSGNNEKEKYIYSFENINKSYDMRIQLENINANAPLVQYGYDSKGDILKADGIVNLDLRINDDGFFGKGKFENGNLLYKDLSNEVKNINLDLNFMGEKISIKGDYYYFDKKGLFNVDYESGKGVDVNFNFKNFNFDELATYKILEDTNIKIDDFNFDNVNVNLSVKNNFKAQIDFESKLGFKKEKIAVSGISGQFVYENGIMKVNNFHADSKWDKEGKTVERELKGNLYFRNKDGKVEVEISTPQQQFLSNIKLDFLFNIDKDIFSFRLNSTILDVIGRYNLKNNILSLEQKKNFKMVYDVKNNLINHLNGYVDCKFDDYYLKTNLKTNDGHKIELNASLTSNEKIEGQVLGFIDIQNKDYNFKLKTKELNIQNDMFGVSGDIEGFIINERNNINGEFLLNNLSVGLPKQNFEVSGISGTVNLKKLEDLSLIFQGDINKVKYSDYEIGGFKSSVKYSDNTISIKNISNKFLTLSGNYSIINSNLDLSVSGQNIDEETIKISEIKYNIGEIVGNISGKLDELQGKIQIKNGEINLGDEKKITFGGDIDYFKNIISTENFKINQNSLNLKYFLDKKEGNYNINVFESSISDYILGVKFRVIGTSEGVIKGSQIEGDFRGSLNEFYYKENKIPNILFNISYDNDKVVFKDIEFLSIDDKKFAEASGTVNIKDKNFDFIIPKQTVDINKFLQKEETSALLDINGKAEGTFDKYTFELKGENGKISYKDVIVDKIGFDLNGDNEKLNLDNFVLSYLGNQLKANGFYNLLDKKYMFDIESSEIDLSFLKIFLNSYGIDNISGNSKLKFVMSDSASEGNILLRNFDMLSKKYGIEFKNLNGDVEFDEKSLRIKKINGFLNDGSLNIKGSLKTEKLMEHIFDENFEDIDYNVILEGKNINYSYEDYFNLNFNTRLTFRKRGIFGNVTINEGKIENILKENFGLVKVVKDFVLNFLKRNKSERIIMENSVNSSVSNQFMSDLAINIGFNIDKGIELDIAKATNIFTNIKGKIFGHGNLIGKLGSLNFLGETDIQEGGFTLNGNKFIVDKAVIIFNDREAYIPDLNPSIVFSTSSIINNKNFEISLDGPVKNLTFTVRSGNEVSVNSLDSVLNGDGTYSSDGNNNVSILFTNIIGGQISDAILNPFVNILRNIGFSNLSVRSNIVTEEKKKDTEEDSAISFGAYIEAESPIYKDKIFWKVKANFMNEQDSGNTSNEGYNYGVADYDVSIYKMVGTNTSVGVGVQKLRENMEFNNKQRNMNYYIELKFEKKFDF